jgi:hypothetical protein
MFGMKEQVSAESEAGVKINVEGSQIKAEVWG